MLSPNKVSSVNCFDRLNYIRSYDGTYSSGLTEQLKASFEQSPDYVEVYKNYNFGEAYKTRIYEGNESDKKLGFKYMQSYPYDLPQFQIGDYIHWKFDHKDYSTWLMISFDSQHLYNMRGRIMKCNNRLKWIDENGVVKSYECVFQDSLTYASFKYGERGIIQVNGTIGILVQQNEDTRKIYRNQRFLFDGIPYVVNNFIKSVDENFLELDLIETQRVDKDDLINNIAYNGIESIEPPEISTTIVTPETNDILEGDTETFKIQRYLNGVAQSDTYTFSVSGVPASHYEFSILTNNSFSIKNIKTYDKKALSVSCFNETTKETSMIDIWLTGGW